MDSSTIDIIISVITGVFTVLGAIIASTAGNKGLHDKIQNQMRVDQAVTDNKIETLTAEVKKHNDFASRVPVLEEQMKSTAHRLESIEKRMERED
jgi:hypothetical protein